MSSFESTAVSNTSNSAGGGAGGSAASASSASGGITVDGGSSAAKTAPAPGVVAAVGGDSGSTQLNAEETAAVISEQPTGDVPSFEEMDDRKDATSSSDNLLPTDKLQNGLKNVSELHSTAVYVCI